MSNVKPDLLAIARRLNVRCIYDCGSRDAKDGIELARALEAEELHVFECNPPAIELCRHNLGELRPQGAGGGTTAVHFNPLALSDREGELDFFPIDPARTVTDWPDGNIGASSLYQANPAYRYERYVQERIRVTSTTLDAYCRTRRPPDLLWLDLQGAELRALAAARTVLPRVALIHVEVCFRPLYFGQALFWDVHRFLKKRFRLIRLYDVRNRWLLRVRSLLGREKWFTDALYLNRALPCPADG